MRLCATQVRTDTFSKAAQKIFGSGPQCELVRMGARSQHSALYRQVPVVMCDVCYLLCVMCDVCYYVVVCC